MSEPAGLTPVQERTLALLRRPEQPVIFSAETIAAIVDQAAAGVAELSVRLAGEKLWVSKGFLSSVHGCEANHLAPDEFEWKPANAAGFVAHKAIELGLHWRGTPAPEQLVDEAIASLADDTSRRGDFVAGLSDAEHAALRCKAVERTTRFMQDFPPLDPRSHPMLEAAVKWRPEGTIELGGKADLVIGRPEGRESRRLIIDFKSGGRALTHREDLRFYALLETLAFRVPPRRLVTYYLDYAECEVEDVTIGVLQSALRRTLDGIALHAELTVEGRPPLKRPGYSCRWCPLQDGCAEGRSFLYGDTDQEVDI
ncbi:MAG: PD-(D/E)XK nuclease family protein [Ilumatobacteraceae bacterium]